MDGNAFYAGKGGDFRTGKRTLVNAHTFDECVIGPGVDSVPSVRKGSDVDGFHFCRNNFVRLCGFTDKFSVQITADPVAVPGENGTVNGIGFEFFCTAVKVVASVGKTVLENRIFAESVKSDFFSAVGADDGKSSCRAFGLKHS